MFIDKIKYLLKTDKITRAYDRARYCEIKRMCANKERDVTNAMCGVMQVGHCFWIEPDDATRDVGFLVPEKCYVRFCPHFHDTQRCTRTDCYAYNLNKVFFDARDEYVAASGTKYNFWKNACRRDDAARADIANKAKQREKELADACKAADARRAFAKSVISSPVFVRPDTPRNACENCINKVYYDSMTYCPDYDHGMDIAVTELCEHFSFNKVCKQDNCLRNIDNINMFQAVKDFENAQRAYRNFTGKKWKEK